jgi:hypothetical protein
MGHVWSLACMRTLPDLNDEVRHQRGENATLKKPKPGSLHELPALVAFSHKKDEDMGL